MKQTPHIIPRRPEGQYDFHAQEWAQYAYELAAAHNLPMKQVAAKIGVPADTLKKHTLVNAAIRQGLADFAAWVTSELVFQAAADVDLAQDPVERSQIRSLKADALRTLHKAVSRREEMEEFRDTHDEKIGALKNLSTEELRKKAEELLK